MVLVAGGTAQARDQLLEEAVAIHRDSSGRIWMVLEPSVPGAWEEESKIPGSFRAWSDSAGLPLARRDSLEIHPMVDGSFEPRHRLHYVDKAGRKIRCRVVWSREAPRETRSGWIPRWDETSVGLAGVFNHRGEPSPWLPTNTAWLPNSPESIAAFLPDSFVQGRSVRVRNGTWLSALFDKGDRSMSFEVDPWGAGRRLCDRPADPASPPVGDSAGNCPFLGFALGSTSGRGSGVLLDRSISDSLLSAPTPWGRFVPGKLVGWGNAGQVPTKLEHPISVHGRWRCSPGLRSLVGKADVPATVLIDGNPDPIHRLRIRDASALDVLLFPDSLWVPPGGFRRLGNGAGLTIAFRPKDQSASVRGWRGIVPRPPANYLSHPRYIPRYWKIPDSVPLAGGQGIHAIVEEGELRVDRLGNVTGSNFRMRPQAGPSAGTDPSRRGRWFDLHPVEVRVVEETFGKGGRRIEVHSIAQETDGAEDCIVQFGRHTCETLGILPESSAYSRIPASVDAYDACVKASRCSRPAGSDSGLASGWTESARWPESIQVGLDSSQARQFCQFRGGRLPTLNDGFVPWKASEYGSEGWVVPSADRWLWNTLFVWCQGGVQCGLPPSLAPFQSSEYEVEPSPVPVHARGSVLCVPLDTLGGTLPFR